MLGTQCLPWVPARQRWQFSAAAGILGWILDAFDFFVLVFLFDVLAAHFHVSKGAIVATITATLVMRPVGALLMGSLADRFGRKRPLIACVIYFSIVTALTPFAPNYTAFVVLRALYGIGMGGYWGIGASLVMESSPVRWRGLFSGMMQSGYPMGYLLAAVAMKTVEPRFGWQGMFLGGLGIAAVIVVLTVLGPESAAWARDKVGGFGEIWRTLGRFKKDLIYCTALMSVMICFSHGTQDLYPDFLKVDHHLSKDAIANIAILYNAVAIGGSLAIGNFSDRLGRRRSTMIALGIAAVAIPGWAFGAHPGVLIAGAVAMQVGVQGAWGVMPAHLNELSPNGVRGLFPGFVYQMGTVLGGGAVPVEHWMADRFGYPAALAGFEGCVILVLIVLIGFGPERRGRDLAG